MANEQNYMNPIKYWIEFLSSTSYDSTRADILSKEDRCYVHEQDALRYIRRDCLSLEYSSYITIRFWEYDLIFNFSNNILNAKNYWAKHDPERR